MTFARLRNEGREDWLEQRRGFVTATEIARLAGSQSEWPRVWREKHFGSDFHGNAVTRWGHEREPVIAAHIHNVVDSRLVPNSDLLVLDGTRIAATPDMTPDDSSGVCEVIGEIKTSGKQLIPDDIPRKYLDQVQAQLMVTGAEVCVFACEVRETTADGFAPGGLRETIIHADMERQVELRDIAERFLEWSPPELEEGDGADFETQALAQSLGEAEVEVSRLRAELRAADAVRDGLRADLLDRLGPSPRAIDFPGVSLEVVQGRRTNVFDRKGLAADYPELAEKYSIQRDGNSSIKVTLK